MAVSNVITGPQDGLLQASRTIGERCSQFPEVIATIPRFAELSSGLQALITRIDAAVIAKQTSRHTSNVTNEKNGRLATLIDALHGVAVVIVDMAAEEKNKDWDATAKRALKTKMKPASEEGQLAIANEFVAFLKTIDAKLLTHYGIDAVEIAGLDQQIKDIAAWRLKKEVIIDQKSLDNGTLASLFQQLKEEKEKMNRLSERFATKAPEFYAIYQKAQTVNLKSGNKATRAKKEKVVKTPQTLIAKVKKGATKKKKALANGSIANNINNFTETAEKMVLPMPQS